MSEGSVVEAQSRSLVESLTAKHDRFFAEKFLEAILNHDQDALQLD